MSRGIFLVFEGIDASGKSTQARRTADHLGARFAFEPGDTMMGADLRRWVLDADTPMAPETEALLMLSDRSHHVRTVIEPLLGAGVTVVCDRFSASTLVYQGYGRGVDLDQLVATTSMAIGSCQPDLTILLDISLEVANERRARDAKDRFESADLDFHRRVRDGYLHIAAEQGDRWWVLDGSKDVVEIGALIDERVATLSRSRG